MKRSVYFAIFIFAFLLHLPAEAQKARLARANRLMENLNFQGAIETYEYILRRKSDPQATFNLAKCYRMVGDMEKAEYWYGQAVLLPEVQPEHHLYLGMAQQANGKCQLAVRQFEKYLSMNPSSKRGRNLLESCADSVQRELQQAGALFQVERVEDVNTRFDDFAAVFYDDGIVFCSERDTASVTFRRSAWTGRPFVNMYYADAKLLDEDLKDYKYGDVQEFDLVNTRFHDGPMSETKNGELLFFTRNNYRKGQGVGRNIDGLINLKVFYLQKIGGQYGDVMDLSFNSDEYSVAHPAVSQDGTKLFFSSDMPGGQGGMDLYVCFRETGQWGAPLNLGPSINTEGDELFPTLDRKGTLYFASNGHKGLGGLDIYSTTNVKGVWQEVLNVGAPVNSTMDDFSYMVDSAGTFGYFSSNRPDSLGNTDTDIFSFTRLVVNSDVLVFDKRTGLGVSGVTVRNDCMPRASYTTNVDGKIYDVPLPLNRKCVFSVESDIYDSLTVQASTIGYTAGAQLLVQIPLEGADVVYQNQGQILDTLGNPVEGATVRVSSNCGTEVEKAVTNENGEYLVNNIQPNCCYLVKIEKEGYLTSTTNFCTDKPNPTESYKSKVTMTSFNPAGKGGLEVNTEVIVPNIYYKYDKAEIEFETSEGLQQLLSLLENNPNLIVEIRSHTDSRGSDAYNYDLSNNRAKAIVDYLVSNGISETRLGYRGMGEEELVNACTDGTQCTEEQHAQNRRTEFRVIGNLND